MPEFFREFADADGVESLLPVPSPEDGVESLLLFDDPADATVEGVDGSVGLSLFAVVRSCSLR